MCCLELKAGKLCVCVCVHAFICVCILGGRGLTFDDKFVYVNIVCFDAGCF